MHHITYPSRAFVARVNQFVDLNPLLPGESCCATGINNDGLVVGWTGSAGGNRAFLHDSNQGGVTILDPLAGHTSVGASSVNEPGHVAGISTVDGAASRLFFYRDGEMFDAGEASWVTGLNNSDVAVGSFGGYPWRAYRADVSSGTAVFEDLGFSSAAGMTGSHGNGINNSGVVVGHSFGSYGEPWRAFVHYPAGHPEAGFHDLQSRVEGADGWALEQARAINDRGVIVGNGKFHGEPRSFILYPNRVKSPFQIAYAEQFIKLFGGVRAGGGGIGLTAGGKPVPIPLPLLLAASESERDFQLGIALENFARGLGDHSLAGELHALGVRLQEEARLR